MNDIDRRGRPESGRLRRNSVETSAECDAFLRLTTAACRELLTGVHPRRVRSSSVLTTFASMISGVFALLGLFALGLRCLRSDEGFRALLSLEL